MCRGQTVLFGTLILLVGLTQGAVKDPFLACLRVSTPAFGTGTPLHTNLTALNIRNDHVTPTAIVLARTPEHVSDAIRCARQADRKVCARSGGHSLVGHSLCPDVLIDVGPMKSVSINKLTGVATVGAGAILGEVLWTLGNAGRWFSVGVCPAVGISGYILGGGYGPYSGRLGLACDALEEVTLVDRNGYIIKASAKLRQELFWGLCGAGGGQFGIATSFKIRTVSSKPYDNAVYFRYNWQLKYAGELLEKWTRFDEMGGQIRMRMLIGPDNNGSTGLGVCFNVTSIRECEQRLEKTEFFRTQGRQLKLIQKAKSALELHAFYGPGGGWGQRVPTNLRKALLEERYSGRGKANDRTYHSAFLKTNFSAKFWQSYADYCANLKLKTVRWSVCEILVFKNALSKPLNNAFAHRDSFLLTHFILGTGSVQERSSAYQWMTRKLAPYIRGVYVNYPELELKNYATMYWGKNLCRLRRLKTKFDPDLFFANPQPIPLTSWKINDECTQPAVRFVIHNRLSRFILGHLVDF